MRARATAAAALLCCAAAVSAPAAAVPATKLRRTRPENAINVTVVALRPYNISTLNDKDSADAAGDVFFYVGDTLPQKYACKRTTHAMGCGDNSILVHDQVYTVSMLEVDGTFGEEPACNSGHACNKYQMCNPVVSDPSGATWRCNCKAEQHCNHSAFPKGIPWFGRVRVHERYPSQPNAGSCPSDLKSCPWTTWKYQTSKLVGGLWYSTPKNGNCDDPYAEYCTWRLVDTVKTADATCVNTWLHKAVETRGSHCFEGCGTISKSKPPRGFCLLDLFR